MARKLILTEEALVKLGSEKLARLVKGEALRNVAFRKLVMAALAATKGPEAVAAIIDKRLAGLDRAKSFIDWDKSKAFTADIAATLAAITGELVPADPDSAINRLIRFLASAERVFERVDDSTGRLQEVYHDAAAALPDLLGRLDETGKASIQDRLLTFAISDDYGFLSKILPNILAHLPPKAVDDWDTRLCEAERSLGPVKDERRDWKRRAKLGKIIGLRQAIADHRGDVDAFIDLETGHGLRDTIAIAQRLCDAGRYRQALEWVRKGGRASVEFMTFDDLADEEYPIQSSDFVRTQLEIPILEKMGDRAGAQDLRWKTFETMLDAGVLRDYIARLPDFAEFDVLDKAFAHAASSTQKYCALNFFLKWPRLDLAAKLIVDRQNEWKGRDYEALVPAAEMLEADYPLATTILYRTLLNDILDRARSPAYGHAARYLAKLEVLAAHEDVSSMREPHEIYRAAMLKKHGRKSGFWSLVKKPK
jgi:hypothetical protein